MKLTESAYTLFTLDVSYYCGKMEAYLKYKEVPLVIEEVRWDKIGGEIFQHTGNMKVPAVKTPDGKWLHDTTPMIDWFEEKYPRYSVLPENPALRFICRLLEDYADEWMWRPALYYRWMFAEDRRLYGHRFMKEFSSADGRSSDAGAERIAARQTRLFLEKDGMSDSTNAHIESIYIDTLARLETILAQQDFLMGAKPCLVDYGFFASMFRHFGIDPTPAAIMRKQAPNVVAWLGRMWAARGSRYSGKAWHSELSELPFGWAALLKDVGEAYLPYLHGTALAFQQGEKNFSSVIQGVEYQDLTTVHYRVFCREQLQKEFLLLEGENREVVEAWLRPLGVIDMLMADGVIESNWDPNGLLPFGVRGNYAEDESERTRQIAKGTPWGAPLG